VPATFTIITSAPYEPSVPNRLPLFEHHKLISAPDAGTVATPTTTSVMTLARVHRVHPF
jgi:hypothetical protein